MNELYLFKFKDKWYGSKEKEEVEIGTDKDLFKWVVEELSLERFLPMTVKRAAEEFGMPYSTLVQAVRNGRVEAKREMGVWLVTRDAVEKALECGKLRRR